MGKNVPESRFKLRREREKEEARRKEKLERFYEKECAKTERQMRRTNKMMRELYNKIGQLAELHIRRLEILRDHRNKINDRTYSIFKISTAFGGQPFT
ncbi:MAG: hypothetical protein FWC22_08750 [Treponema sp.]|nr:hypothetical protein [Treponema sp.]